MDKETKDIIFALKQRGRNKSDMIYAAIIREIGRNPDPNSPIWKALNYFGIRFTWEMLLHVSEKIEETHINNL